MKYPASGVFLVVILGLFSSCALHNWEDSVITNNSESPVAFKFFNTDEFILNTNGESVSFKTEAYQRLEYFFPDKKVYFTYKATNEGYTGEFKDRDSWEVKVHNTLDEKATLEEADGWMDEMKDILPGNDDDDNHTGKIYTNNPIFSVKTKSGRPATVKFNFVDADVDVDNISYCYVTIQWGL